MKTYFGYLFEKLKEAWKEDKFQFFFLIWVVSAFVGPILLLSNMFVTFGFLPDQFNSEQINSVILSPVGITALVFISITGVGIIIMSSPYWGTYLCWTWQIIKSPYSITKWLIQQLTDSYKSYKNWKQKQELKE